MDWLSGVRAINSNELFSKLLNEIENEVAPNTYSIWFSKLDLISIENNVINIKVPLQIHKKMLTDNYGSLLDTTIYSLTGTEYTFKFLLEEELEEIKEEDSNLLKENIEDKIEWNTNLIKSMTFDNYMIGDSNRLAFVAAKAVVESPGTIHNPLFLYARSGLGKTHLMHAIGNELVEKTDKTVLYTTSNDFMNDFTGIVNNKKGISNLDYATEFKNKYRNVDVLMIDDIQFLVGAERTQQEFFHTFNSLHQENKQIIISSDRSPDDLNKIEERLRSRFMWGLPVDIYPPEFELRCKIIKSKIKGTILEEKVNNDVIEYIANSCLNDVRHIEGTINRLMAYTAMMIPDKITLNFAIEALKDYVNKNVFADNSIQSIQKVIADYFEITVDDLKGKKRTQKIIRPRHIAMYLARKETDESLAKIGLEFGGRDHSTVIAAYNKINKELQTNNNLNELLTTIKKML